MNVVRIVPVALGVLAIALHAIYPVIFPYCIMVSVSPHAPVALSALWLCVFHALIRIANNATPYTRMTAKHANRITTPVMDNVSLNAQI